MIVLVVGAGILLVFFSQFLNTSDIDKDICKTSVISRATLPVAKGYVPLKCQTEKICITGKLIKGDCEEFENEDNVLSIRVGNNAKGLDQVHKVYAQETLGCWELMGQGKVSIFSQAVAENYGVGSVYPSCVVCSRIAIDHESLDKVPFENMNVEKYMTTHAIGNSDETYFDRMLGEGYARYTVEQTINLPDPTGELDKDTGEAIFGSEKELETKNLETEVNPGAKVSETGIVFMQITAPEHGSSLVKSIVTVAGVRAGAGFVPGVKKAVSIVGIKVKAIAAILGVVVQQSNVAYNRYVTASYCGDIEFGDARSGCSAVRTIDYDVESITDYCEVIEGFS